MSQATLEVIRGIAQAAANAYDGALDENGDPIEIKGMKRNEGHNVLDSRTVDGFKVKIQCKTLTILYQSDITIKELHNPQFESEMDRCCEEISRWLKKEYKKVTGKSLSLKAQGESDVMVQTTSRIRVFVTANKNYEIGGMEGVEDRLKPSEDRIEGKFKSFLEQGGWGKKAKNDTRPKSQA